MHYLGVDPGINGAAAIYSTGTVLPDGGRVGALVVDVIDLPTVGDSIQRRVNVLAFAEWIVRYKPHHAILERVNAMPAIPNAKGIRVGMGSTSAFRFGAAFGDIRTTLALCGLPIVYVMPAQWKKYYGLSGPDKEPARLRAIELMPDAAQWLKRKMDHGRAESMLIARWGALAPKSAANIGEAK